LNPRKGARALPLEGQASTAHAQLRHYDLLEWFAFPENGGTWTVQAIFENKGAKLTSAPVTITLRKPGKTDAEHAPMARLHHIPWSNYDTNAFCGDTFDVVKQWPKNRFAKYCHYWNGRYLQNKKEFEKASPVTGSWWNSTRNSPWRTTPSMASRSASMPRRSSRRLTSKTRLYSRNFTSAQPRPGSNRGRARRWWSA
jgi:hypothetical protein